MSMLSEFDCPVRLKLNAPFSKKVDTFYKDALIPPYRSNQKV